MIALPIDPYLAGIVDDARRARAAVIVAAPGAGKTTRVPPALVGDGPVILLQPRRVAARAIAARIAAERSWGLGREVGWQVRFDRKFTRDTQLLVVTEGVLTARLQSDPLLSDFRTIVLDEFHERSIHADVAVALARQAWRAREDLRIVVMSATIDAKPVARFLDDCPVVDVPGRVYPLTVRYAPGQSVGAATVDVLAETTGNVLCFLPGASEIQRAIEDIRRFATLEILPLHGSMSADEQDAALRPSERRRIVVATNIAETSLTVPAVTGVVDTGLQKVARYDADRGIDSLETERVSADAADQRAGRAGREAAGVVCRLWDPRDRLRPHREPDVFRVDLAGPALDIFAWGGDPRTLEWFEPPRRETLDRAIELLERLQLVRQSRLTPIGEQVARYPLHPRLARMLIAADGALDMVRACALLSERRLLPPHAATTTSDILSALDHWKTMAPHVERAARFIADCASRMTGQSALRDSRSARRVPPSAPFAESDFRRATLAGYPDRVARRRATGSASFLMATGTGATLGRESGVRNAEFIVALDVGRAAAPQSRQADARMSPHTSEAIIRVASRVEPEWLTPNSSDVVHRFDPESGRVRAIRVDRYDALVLAEHPQPLDPAIAAQLLAEAWRAREPRAADQQLLRRIAFTGLSLTIDDLLRIATDGARSLDEIRLETAVPAGLRRELDREAPTMLVVPSGRSHPLDYHEDGSVSASVKLQELFGLAETPRIGRRRVPVRIALLAPNGRPVQITQDLRSFWERTYPDVRKELRGRYPKHPWPEDPWSAQPTARARRR